MTANSFFVSALLYSGWRHLLEMVDEKPLIIFHVIRNVCNRSGSWIGQTVQTTVSILQETESKDYYF